MVYQGYVVSNLHTKKASKNPRLASFKTDYLIVYSLVMTSDWLLGAYGYSLYKSYGLSLDTIAGLFIIGYLSSAVFGIL
jgi:Na+-translocating ferredoxin:NAD+ oxidoreductase RnfE subunit